MPAAKHTATLMFLAGIYFASFTIQALLFLNWDVASMLSASQVLLSGGKYVKDIFTPNPPMTLYLYMPPVFISKLFTLDLITVFRIYVYLLCSASLAVCYYAINQYEELCKLQISSLFSIMLAIGYLILPCYEFGNRDHLFLVLVMPYVMIAALRLVNQPVSLSLALTVGIAAGAGFAIKPQFLITFALIELYCLYYRKDWRVNIRVETITIGALLILYALTTILFHRAFIDVIIPFVLRNYYASISQPLSVLTKYPLTVFCLMSALFYLATPAKQLSKPLFPLLFLTLISFIASIYLQRTLFYYHFIPALTIALILSMMLLANYIRQQDRHFMIIIMASLAGFFTLLDVSLFGSSWNYIVFYPVYFYAFFTLLILSLFVINGQFSLVSAVARTLFIITASILFMMLLQETGSFNHQFSLVIMSIISLYLILSFSKHRYFTADFVILTFAISLFYVPAMQEYHQFLEPREYKTGALTKLADFIKSKGAHESIYTFSPAIYFTFPVVYYTNARSSQRFEQLWPILGFAHTNTSEHLQDKQFFISMVADDIRNNKPDLIFVDNVNVNTKHFNYLTFFSENTEFTKEWKSYRYLTTLDLGKINATDALIPVYQRIKN